MREKKWEKKKERRKKRTDRDYATKKTRLYLNQRHSHQKDDSGIHDNPVFAGLIILSEQD